MANRVVYGNSFSENGWPMVDTGSCQWITVPGTGVSLQIQVGQPLAILRAWAADINAYVEPLRDADSACWTATNSVASSNHLSGTAIDLNWNSHPFRVLNAGYNAAQIAVIRELLAFYEDTVFWGNDWDSPKDAMHFQVGYDTYGNPHTADFIAHKIRSDGFSTFRRGKAPAAPTVMTVPVIQKADGTWTSPSPAWAHLIMRESSGNPTIIQQITDVNSGGNEAEGLFQITPRTWRAHGGDEFAPSARLATPQQQAIVAARIFTRNPSGSDWGAGLPGRENAQQLAAGLVATADNQGDEDEMAGWTPELVSRAMVLIENQTGVVRPSLSPFRHVGEGPVNTCGGFAWSADGLAHAAHVERFATVYGDPESILLLWEVSQATDPSRARDKALAIRVLQKVSKADLDNADAHLQAWLTAEKAA